METKKKCVPVEKEEEMWRRQRCAKRNRCLVNKFVYLIDRFECEPASGCGLIYSVVVVFSLCPNLKAMSALVIFSLAIVITD